MTGSSVRGRILHFTSSTPVTPEYYADGVLVIDDGKIVEVGDAVSMARRGFDLQSCRQYPDALIMPGFLDVHVHSSQLGVMASYGPRLLEWLERFTYPEERKFDDEAFAARAAEEFLDCLLMHGTTTAMVFTTSHPHSADLLFEAAWAREMRLVAGKVLMDRNAPAALLDTASSGYEDSAALIRRWHNKGRLGYAVTPRFSITSSKAQMESVGRLHREFPGTWIQTHLSENPEEIERVKTLFPGARDYLDTYEMFGINDERTIFAHGIHLTPDELQRLADGGARRGASTGGGVL